MRTLFLSLVLLTASAKAGYTSPRKTVSLGDELPARHNEQPRCAGGSGGGISDAARVAEYSGILKAKAEKLDFDLRSCTFDGDEIAIVRTSGGFMTFIGGQSALIYVSSGRTSDRLVMPKSDTWMPPICPPVTVEAIMSEQLRRVFACYPEKGHSVTTRAEDEAFQRAIEDEVRRNLR